MAFSGSDLEGDESWGIWYANTKAMNGETVPLFLAVMLEGELAAGCEYKDQSVQEVTEFPTKEKAKDNESVTDAQVSGTSLAARVRKARGDLKEKVAAFLEKEAERLRGVAPANLEMSADADQLEADIQKLQVTEFPTKETAKDNESVTDAQEVTLRGMPAGSTRREWGPKVCRVVAWRQ
ncbi:unnamed protein product [Symbiodinium sp. CCMP2592]|nr:unnamed protein product [Symbiodinium sp. CCMP2592]